MLKIHTVLCRAGIMDNYSYILFDEATGISAVVDPSEPRPIIEKLTQLGLRPSFILNTHHHFDHTDGNFELKERYGAQVVGNSADAPRIPGFDLGVEPGKTFAFALDASNKPTICHCEEQSDVAISAASICGAAFTIIDVSAHTQNHILYYFEQDKALFTGDTLFNLCIGGLFEGTPPQMFAALQKIKALPDDVLFYPGHEYTLYGAADARKHSPNSSDLATYLTNAEHKLAAHQPVGPLTLGEEKKCNPYLLATTVEELARIC